VYAAAEDPQREEDRAAQGPHDRQRQPEDDDQDGADQHHPDVQPEALGNDRQRLPAAVDVEEGLPHPRPAGRRTDPDHEQGHQYDGADGGDRTRPHGPPAPVRQPLELQRRRLPVAHLNP
jgi:hypothetical protein